MRIGYGVCAVALFAVSTICSAKEGGAPLRVDWTLTKTGATLKREAVISVTDRAGNPVVDADVQLSIDMPSMPGMHKVPTIKARPSGTAGRYAASFELEMPGEWVAQIEVKAPVRVKTIKKFHAE